MADNTDEKHLEDPSNSPLKSTPDNTLQTKGTDINNQNPETENMEVHKHPHHVTHKKKFGEYLLEFFMLFLAVFLGFVAENIRENISKHETERRLMEMVGEDLRLDESKLDSVIIINQTIFDKMDTMRGLVYAATHAPLPDSSIKKMYYFFRFYSLNVRRYLGTPRTLNLFNKNDAFNSLRKQNVSDSIGEYFDLEARSQTQWDAFRTYQFSAYDVGETIFNTELLENNSKREEENSFMLATQKFELMTSEKKTLLLYANKLYVAAGVYSGYINRLKLLKQRAASLVALIKKEYH
jgi:hypothetical protein